MTSANGTPRQENPRIERVIARQSPRSEFQIAIAAENSLHNAMKLRVHELESVQKLVGGKEGDENVM
jgi:hypothetical protein